MTSSLVERTRKLEPWNRTVDETLEASDCTTYEASATTPSPRQTLSPTNRLSVAIRSPVGRQSLRSLNRSLIDSEVFMVPDEFIFKTKTEFDAYKVAGLRKVITDPEAFRLEAASQLKVEKDMIEASREFGTDPVLTMRAIKILRDVQLKGSRKMDLEFAEKVIEISAEETAAKAKLELQKIDLRTGNFSGMTAADLVNVEDVNA